MVRRRNINEVDQSTRVFGKEYEFPMNLGEHPTVITLNIRGIGNMQRWAQTYTQRNSSLGRNLRSNDDKPARSLTLRPLLSCRPHRARGHVFHLDQFLHGEYHTSGLGRVRVIHRLHAPSQAESGQRALNAFAKGDSRASEGDAEVGAWLCRCGCGCGGRGWC